MGLYIPDECSKHRLSGLKVCGYRSPLYRGWPSGCASGLQLSKDSHSWILGISCFSTLSMSEQFSAYQEANVGVYRVFLLFWGEYPALYDYWIGGLRIGTMTPTGRGWQTHGKVWRFLRIKLVCSVFYWGKGTHSEIILWSISENQY